jgi:hypothetical protein
MTHSLHRSGSIDSLRGDYVWFMYQAKGINDKNVKPKALEFIAVAEASGSENWGDVKTGTILKIPREQVIENISDKSRIRGVFTSRDQVINFLQEIKKRDLGMSVVISGLLEEVLPACEAADVTPHTINYALGIWGKKDLLPSQEVLDITTMCGHHIIAADFVKYIAEQVKKSRLTPEQGAMKLASFCYCGIFNQVRCAKLLSEFPAD